MPLKDILAHVAGADHGLAALEVAASLAAAHGAHLAALYVRPPAGLPGYVAPAAESRAFEMRQRLAAEAQAQAEAALRDIAGRVGVEPEWRTAEDHGGAAVSLHARYADLAVVAQADPDRVYPPGLGDVAEHVLLNAGRPVLVVPYAGRFPTVGERVLIAWNGSREATRAVHDALPLLERAKQATVLVVDGDRAAANLGDLPGSGIGAQLARHGIRVEVDEERSGDVQVGSEVYTDVRNDIDVADRLLARMVDFGADLFVMGGYGHTRLRELVMGGVSRHILRHMTVPVLLSH